jgi:hypothetical protein
MLRDGFNVMSGARPPLLSVSKVMGGFAHSASNPEVTTPEVGISVKQPSGFDHS